MLSDFPIFRRLQSFRAIILEEACLVEIVNNSLRGSITWLTGQISDGFSYSKFSLYN